MLAVLPGDEKDGKNDATERNTGNAGKSYMLNLNIPCLSVFFSGKQEIELSSSSLPVCRLVPGVSAPRLQIPFAFFGRP